MDRVRKLFVHAIENVTLHGFSIRVIVCQISQACAFQTWSGGEGRQWKNFLDKRKALSEERGRLAQFIFGEPQANFSASLRELCLVCGLHLYNRWKSGAEDNLSALIQYLQNSESKKFFLRVFIPGLIYLYYTTTTTHTHTHTHTHE